MRVRRCTRSLSFSEIGRSWSSLSATMSTGSIGGVIAILYARAEDSAKCCSDIGVSSHLMKSRTIDAASCTECSHSTPGRRIVASMRIADDDEYRNSIAICVVNTHRGVLQSDGPMRENRQRLAFDFRVAVRHGDCGLFVAASDEFGLLVATIVDDRFVQRAETGPRIGAHVFDVERPEDVDHEVGAAMFRRQDVQFRRRGRFGSRILQRRCAACNRLPEQLLQVCEPVPRVAALAAAAPLRKFRRVEENFRDLPMACLHLITATRNRACAQARFWLA